MGYNSKTIKNYMSSVTTIPQDSEMAARVRDVKLVPFQFYNEETCF